LKCHFFLDRREGVGKYVGIGEVEVRMKEDLSL
jgi:hypothetical protein